MSDDRSAIVRQIAALIEETLEWRLPEKVDETSRLYEDLHIDSLMTLQLIVHVEEQFRISVPEEDVDPSTFRTMGALVSFVQEQQCVRE